MDRATGQPREIIRRQAEVAPLYIRQVEGVPNFGDVHSKPMISGDHMTLLDISYDQGAGAPSHVHQHETLCYVVSGHVRMHVDDQEFELLPGDTCIHPRGVPHGIRALVPSRVLEIKSPAQPLDQFLDLRDE